MTRGGGILFVVVVLLQSPALALAVTNPDQISIFFPAFEGPGNLGRNVSTVLSLQLAQTTRRMPWPDNPQGHDFGEGMIRWAPTTLADQSHQAAASSAQATDLLAQIVVWGSTYRYGDSVVVDVNVTLPEYQPAGQEGCNSSLPLKCDYRQKNFERWDVVRDDRRFSVDPPRRRYGVSAIVLKPEVVDGFQEASGLPIRPERDGGPILGNTGDEIRFIEFNRGLTGAPTKIRSRGIEGYVSLPELSEQTSEFADMVGGTLQVFRGDWDAAEASFTRVLENPKTRTPLLIDALLYRGMVETRRGGDGRPDFAEAAKVAPYDDAVTRFRVMAALAIGESRAAIGSLLEPQSYLFEEDDPWFQAVSAWLAGD